jgi:GMP synthase-like glutamine amidotransferase
MLPVAIFRHSPTEGPGYFATYLERHRIPWKLVPVDAGAAVPESAGEFSGLAFMGGPMSVNDALPWIPSVLQLIRGAVDRDVPVLGHCLGGQLMAKALGGAVARNPVKEIGWGRVDVADNEAARAWFGGAHSFLSYHWHGETFTVPAGAVCVASSPYCAAQAFVLGKHLGLQCHVEMTEEMVRAWAEAGKREIEHSAGPAVQSGEEMQRDLPARVGALRAVAERLYGRWIEGLVQR